jgi:taurine dioxygenase
VNFEIDPLDAPLGAEVRGLDISGPLDAATVDRLRDAWHNYLLLRFRGQTLSDDRLLAFTRYFGQPEFPPSKLLNYSQGSGQAAAVPPEINIISNVREGGKPIGQLGNGEASWHSDSGFVEIPPAGSVLHALEIPPEGGNTSFLDMYAALETLPGPGGGARCRTARQCGHGAPRPVPRACRDDVPGPLDRATRVP